MNCRRIRDMIITDYSDNELEEKVRGLVEEHLLTCAACRAFKEKVEQLAVAPLRTQEILSPPMDLWLRIKHSIEQEKSARITERVPAAVLSFRARWLELALAVSLLLFTTLAGHYFATGILGNQTQPQTATTTEIVNTLALSEFQDMPNTQVETVYNNVIGG